jgi:hypothetical protein
MVGIYHGASEVTDPSFGGVAIKEVYAGAIKVWPTAPAPTNIMACVAKDWFGSIYTGFDDVAVFMGEMTPRLAPVVGKDWQYLYHHGPEGLLWISWVGIAEADTWTKLTLTTSTGLVTEILRSSCEWKGERWQSPLMGVSVVGASGTNTDVLIE